MGDWTTHGSATGGNYQCNVFEAKKKEEKFANQEKKREEAKHELQRYMHYFERFNNHDKAEKHAIGLKPVISSKIE
jgi:ariadne-1